MDKPMWALEVARADHALAIIVQDRVAAAPSDGAVCCEIEHLAMTANLFTYASLGDSLGFWSLFPSPHAGSGRIPAWGHARVSASDIEGIEVGTRLFGLFPMAPQVELRGRSSRLGLRETSPHRQALNPVYNQYARASSDDAAARELRAVFQPLFITSFVLALHLQAQDFFGADEVVIVSASSKTAIGTAHQLRGQRPILGLTSPRQRPWLAGQALYDRVVDYDALRAPLSERRCVVVDFSGSERLLATVTAALGPRLVRVVRVGATHGGKFDVPETPGSDDHTPFFGPAHIEHWAAEWGPQGFDERLGAALQGFLAACGSHFERRHAGGPQQMLAAYQALQRGEVAAHEIVLAHPSS